MAKVKKSLEVSLCNTRKVKHMLRKVHKQMLVPIKKVPYNHRLGRGGYKHVIPKWRKMVKYLIA
jgi:hypothetical protein